MRRPGIEIGQKIPPSEKEGGIIAKARQDITLLSSTHNAASEMLDELIGEARFNELQKSLNGIKTSQGKR